MTPERRQIPVETIVLAILGVVFVGIGGFICVSAYRSAQAPGAEIVVQSSPALPPALPADAAPAAPEPAPGPVFAPAPGSIFTPPPLVEAQAPPARKPVRPPSAPVFETPAEPSIALGPSAPMPPRRPIQLNPAPPTPTPSTPGAKPTEMAALTPDAKPAALSSFDRFTAVYDLTAHTVYLPDGSRLEAHSGLGPIKDDPTHVDQKDRGATPPHVYDLTMREDLFHGVQALRLNPVGGADAIYGRAGLLAHTYMLGPNGDSNGCVSFKNYDAFLQAFQNGVVKRLAVVAGLK